MKHIILLIIITVFFSNKLLSQSLKLTCESLDSIIIWDQENQITWTDYKGSLDTLKKTLSFADAVSSVSFYFDFYRNSNQDIQFVSFPYFNKYTSWVKADSSLQLLNHERAHFNIAECFVRKARKEISELSENKVYDIDIYYQHLKSLKKEYDSINIAYDTETMFGSFDIYQNEWNDKIKKELKSLDNYAVDYCKKYFETCNHPPQLGVCDRER